MRVVLEGDKALMAQFKTLSTAVQTEVISGVLDAAAEEVKEGAETRAPKGRSGKLSRNIKVQGSGIVQREVGPTRSAFYGVMVEKVTGPRRQKSTGKFTGSMPAKPFMRPAAESPTVQEKARQEFKNRMRKYGAV